MNHRAGLVIVLALSPLAAQAEMTNATLYPSHAELTFKEVHPVTSGTGVLEITGLPVSLQERGLQAELSGIPGATIQQIQTGRVEQAQFVAEERKRLERLIEESESRMQAYKDDIRAWEQQVTLMTRSAEAPGELSASELNDMAQTVKETTMAALSEIRKIRPRLERELEERDRLERERARLKEGEKASKWVRLRYKAPTSGEVTATLTFLTPEASWRSEYNARLDTELEDRPGGELVLEHLAVVSQATGSDWSNVTLELATANARKGTSMPEVNPWVVRPGPVAYRSDAMAKSNALMESAMPAGQEVTVQHQSQFTQSYQIADPVDVPSGADGQRLRVQAYEIPVEVMTWTAPVLDPTGYLYASGTFESEFPVPAGPVTLFRDGQSVGQTNLGSLTGGQSLDLGFGVDNGVEVTVVNELERTGEEGVWKSENVQRRQNRFEITNYHTGAILLRVFDRLPVSQQDDMTVKPLEISEPVERNANDRKGVMVWERTLPGNDTIEIQSGFEVRVPEGQSLPRL